MKAVLAVVALAGGALACSGRSLDGSLVTSEEPTAGPVIGTAAGSGDEPDETAAGRERGGDDVQAGHPDAATRADAAASDAGLDASGSGGGAESDAAMGHDAGTKDPGTRRFGEPCNANALCASGVCVIQGNSGYCSLRCTAINGPLVCPPPSLGCNAKGFCRKP